MTLWLGGDSRRLLVADANETSLAPRRRQRTHRWIKDRVDLFWLAALVGRYSEAMGVAVIVSDKELGLSVVAIHYLRN